MRAANQIRPIAIAIIQDDQQRLLVTEAVDPVSGATFSRPPGGGIEFGESSAMALTRELREELGATVVDAELLTVLENRFAFGGVRGHEIVFAYRATVSDLAALHAISATADAGHPVLWRSLDEFDGDQLVLVPSGLKFLLAED